MKDREQEEEMFNFQKVTSGDDIVSLTLELIWTGFQPDILVVEHLSYTFCFSFLHPEDFNVLELKIHDFVILTQLIFLSLCFKV